MDGDVLLLGGMTLEHTNSGVKITPRFGGEGVMIQRADIDDVIKFLKKQKK